MFCTSLRRRSFNFASVLPNLTSSSTLALRENDLATHDFALYIGPKTGRDARQLRIILLSASTVSEIKLEFTIERIQHLSHLTGGQDIAIVFLISPPVGTQLASTRTVDNSADDHDLAGMLAYCKLQSELISRPDLSIPILPLPTLEALPALLQRHLAAVGGRLRVQHPVTTSFELLTNCTVTPPLREQTAFLLSDSFESIKQLAEGCCSFLVSAPDGNSSSSFEAPIFGRSVEEDAVVRLKRLQDLIDPKEWEDMIVIWQEEWTVE